jgi:hypothetical protein
MDQVRDKIRVKHYSLRTEDAYVHRIDQGLQIEAQLLRQQLLTGFPPEGD